MADESNRCWPGYEPVAGKEQHEQGSCRKKPESKSSSGERKFQQSREKQLDNWEKKYPGTSRSAAQHLAAPAKKKAAAKKAASKKKAAAKKAPAKKAASKKRAAAKR